MKLDKIKGMWVTIEFFQSIKIETLINSHWRNQKVGGVAKCSSILRRVGKRGQNKMTDNGIIENNREGCVSR
jgi:hypothetical protein